MDASRWDCCVLPLWAVLLVLVLAQRAKSRSVRSWLDRDCLFARVSNLLFSTGVLLAERRSTCPSAGVGRWQQALRCARLPDSRLRLIIPLLVLAGGIRSAVRVPHGGTILR